MRAGHLLVLLAAAAGGAAAGATLRRRRRRSAPPNPAPEPGPRAPSPRGDVYTTDPADVILPPWVTVAGVTFTAEPLRARSGGYAHLSYAGALAAARAAGAALPSRADLVALSDAARAAGFELDPVTLPDPAMLAAAGIATGDAAAVDAYRNAHMRTQAWAQLHDERVRAQLVARGWDGRAPTSNAGKVWKDGAPTGRAHLMGWRLKSGAWIQDGSTPPGDPGRHDDRYTDYGTLTVLVRKGGPAA